MDEFVHHHETIVNGYSSLGLIDPMLHFGVGFGRSGELGPGGGNTLLTHLYFLAKSLLLLG